MDIIETFPSLPELATSQDYHNLSGIKGENREKFHKCQIRANNDLEAIYCWLDCYRNKPTTYRTYKKESERLLLWCIYWKKKCLSSLSKEDFEEYFKFLDDPQPKEFWCTKGNAKYARNNPNWRPFSGPLSRSAKNSAITIINSLMNYLFTARYLEFNPLNLVRNIKGTSESFQESKIRVFERVLEDDEWDAIKTALFELPESNEKEKKYKARLRLIVSIMFLLGLRISELETHTWNSFRKVQDKWWFFVKGKGDKLGMIPVNNDLINEIKIYRELYNLSSLPSSEENTPIITSIRNNAPITSRQIHKLLKKLANLATNKLKDQSKKEKLRKFSPHWLRHLSATYQDKVGIQFKHIKDNHRHANDMTTRRYIHSIDDERHTEMQKLKLDWSLIQD